MANVIGQRVRRREDPRFLTGKGTYVDDLQIPNALHVTFVRSPWAHAQITEIDASAARELPGIQVFTAADVGMPAVPPPPFVQVDAAMHRPFVAGDRVRFAGDIVAAVLAEERGASVDAAELVHVEYEPLPFVTDIEESVKDETLVFDGVGTNVCLEHPAPDPDAGLFDDCEVVTTGSIVSQRLAACPVEPRTTIAQFDDDGKLTIWLSTQTPHQDKMSIAVTLGLGPDQLRVIAPDVGGGFGGKAADVEDLIVAWLARATARPVRWTETRSEHLVAMHHGRAQRIRFELGGSRNGHVKALRLDILQDAGAYPGLGSFLPMLTALMSSGVYRIPKIEAMTAVVTNTTPVGAVRGAGRPEASQMLERAMDMFAADCGLDPAEVRRRNFIPADAFPYQTVSGAHYDCGASAPPAAATRFRGCHLSRRRKQRHLHARAGELLAYHPRSERRQPRHRTPGCGVHRHGTKLRQPAEQHIGRVAVCSCPRFPCPHSLDGRKLRDRSTPDHVARLGERQPFLPGQEHQHHQTHPGLEEIEVTSTPRVEAGIDVKAAGHHVRQRIGPGHQHFRVGARAPPARRRCRHEPGAALDRLKEPGLSGKAP